MTVEAIAALAAGGTASMAAAPAVPAAASGGFGAWFAQEVGQVNAALATADGDMRALAAGQADNLHQVMIHLEEAKLSFQLLAQVRNHVLEAYQEIMRTQV